MVGQGLAGNAPAAAPVSGTDDDNYRTRLLTAMGRSLAHKGYAATTVADVVATARVSRRTFYEHFANKEELLIATFDHFTYLLTVRIRARLKPLTTWQDRLDAGVDTYVGIVLGNPLLTRALLVEIMSVGDAGLAHRKQVYEGWAGMLRRELRLARTTDTVLEAASREPGPALALATVGAVGELVLAAVDEKDPWTTEQLSSAVVDAILTAALVSEEDRQRLVRLEVDLRGDVGGADVPSVLPDWSVWARS